MATLYTKRSDGEIIPIAGLLEPLPISSLSEAFNQFRTVYTGNEEQENVFMDPRIATFILKMFGSSLVLQSRRTLALLLYGPPGTGKSLLIRCVARQVALTYNITVPVYSLTGATLNYRYCGETEKFIDAIFREAGKSPLSIIVVDRIDTVMEQRVYEDFGNKRSVQAALRQNIDSKDKWTGTIILICTTNNPFAIDDAILKRFVTKFFIDLPSEENRMAMIQNFLRGKGVSEQVIDEVMAKKDVLIMNTEGLSGESIQRKLNNLMDQAFSFEEKRILLHEGEEHEKDGELPPPDMHKPSTSITADLVFKAFCSEEEQTRRLKEFSHLYPFPFGKVPAKIPGWTEFDPTSSWNRGVAIATTKKCILDCMTTK